MSRLKCWGRGRRQRRRKYLFDLNRSEYSKECKWHHGAQKTCYRIHTRFCSTIGVTLSRVIIKRSYPDVALPFVEYGSRVSGSKTSQGEEIWDKHGIQMCLVNPKRKRLLMQGKEKSPRSILQKNANPTRGGSKRAKMKADVQWTERESADGGAL